MVFAARQCCRSTGLLKRPWQSRFPRSAGVHASIASSVKSSPARVAPFPPQRMTRLPFPLCPPGRPCPDTKSASWTISERKRSEEHTSELQSLAYLVCRLLLEKKKKARPHRSKEHTSQLHSVTYILRPSMIAIELTSRRSRYYAEHTTLFRLLASQTVLSI